MTQPPIDPTGTDRPADSSPTQPWPPFAAPEAAPASAGATPGGYVPGSHAPGTAFIPVTPEPGPGQGYTAPASAAALTARASSGSSRIVNIALGAAILVGAVGIAFAVGRATTPASSTAGVPAANAGGPVANGNGNGGAGAGNLDPNANGGDGGAGANGGNLPNASFDLNGNVSGGRGGSGNIDGGLGLERGSRGSLGLSGTVPAVTSDSIPVQTAAGPTIVFSLDGTTTYHQQITASAGDVKTGSKVQVSPSGRIKSTQDANGNINLGPAGSITIVP